MIGCYLIFLYFRIIITTNLPLLPQKRKILIAKNKKHSHFIYNNYKKRHLSTIFEDIILETSELQDNKNINIFINENVQNIPRSRHSIWNLENTCLSLLVSLFVIIVLILLYCILSIFK